MRKLFERQSRQIVCGLIAACLLTLLPGCASSPIAKAAKCMHPQVNLTTNEGMVFAIHDYWTALELCNALNGYGEEQ
jgi:hypothetical protein